MKPILSLIVCHWKYANYRVVQEQVSAKRIIKQELSSCTVIGDKGYLNAEYQLDLFTLSNIRWEVPMRENQHEYKKQSYTC